MLREQGPIGVLTQPEVLEEMQHRCVLCRQWAVDPLCNRAERLNGIEVSVRSCIKLQPCPLPIVQVHETFSPSAQMDEWFGAVRPMRSSAMEVDIQKRQVEAQNGDHAQRPKLGNKWVKEGGNALKGPRKEIVEVDPVDHQTAIKTLSRFVLQQTATPQVLHQDTTLVWFARKSVPTAIPSLFAMGNRWKQEADPKP